MSIGRCETSYIRLPCHLPCHDAFPHAGSAHGATLIGHRNVVSGGGTAYTKTNVEAFRPGFNILTLQALCFGKLD